MENRIEDPGDIQVSKTYARLDRPLDLETASMGQLLSPTDGFVPTHHGTLPINRYMGATVFINHFSDFTYVHLMTEINGEKL